MRGKEKARCGLDFPARITPAYAGKRKSKGPPTRNPRDHPRVCGEKAAIFRAVCVPKGSPPRMRGKEASIFDDGQRLGITPAYAGKSHSLALKCSLRQDHPRVCGEKTKKIP